MSGSVLQSDPSQLSNINTVKIEKMKALQFIMDEQVLILQACITKQLNESHVKIKALALTRA